MTLNNEQELNWDTEPNEMKEIHSMLGVHLGNIHTSVYLFDTVDNQYRLIGQATSPATAAAPYQNAFIGTRSAIGKLENHVSRKLLDTDGQLIQPVSRDGAGVDQVAAVISIDAPRKILAVGLMDGFSLSSAERLARSTNCSEVRTIGFDNINDQKSHIEMILKYQPELIIAAGGTENGATKPVLQLMETVLLALHLIPKDNRPPILFAGNTILQETIRRKFELAAKLYFAPNIRPASDQENLEPAVKEVNLISKEILTKQITGLENLDDRTEGNLALAPSSLGRVIQFLSRARTPDKGVMGLHIGTFSTSMVVGFRDKLSIAVYPELGLSTGLPEFLEDEAFPKLTRWLSSNIPDDYLKAYILNKQFHPASIPATADDLVIEQALGRQLIRAALHKSNYFDTSNAPTIGSNLLPWVEPILAAGDVLNHCPTLAHTLLLLLDGLQPTGATTFVLDPYNTATVLGAASLVNPALAVQVLDSNAFTHLGTVITPVGRAKEGTPILRATMIVEGAKNQESRFEIRQGMLIMKPLSAGRTATIQLHPLQKHDVGMGGAGVGGTIRVKGGALGVVIDGRGRPLSLPKEPEQRFEKFNDWLEALGGI